MVVAGGVVAGGVAGAGAAGCSVAVAGAAGCSVVVAGAVASCGAWLLNHPLAQPMIASMMTTATTPMIVFFLSIMTSLAQNCGRFFGFCVGVRANHVKTPLLAASPSQ